MVNGHLVGIDILSPPHLPTKEHEPTRGRSKEPLKPARGRTLRRNLLGSSLIMSKSKPTPETSDSFSEFDDHDDSGLRNYDVFDPFAELDLPPVASSALAQIAADFEANVPLTEKKHPLRRKPEFSFSGSDAVTFLVDGGYAPSRSAGLRLCRRLAYELALFEHVSMDFDLEDRRDAHYRFTPPHKRQVVELCDEAISKGGGGDEESPHDLDYIADVFEEGVEVGPNVYHYRTYRDTFVGRDAVSFLVESRLARTRQDAVRVGNLLLERDVFRHCRDDHRLKDKFLFYRFVPHGRRARRRPRLQDSVPVEALAARFLELVRPGSDPRRPFENAFRGSSAVDALVEGRLAGSRREAVELGRKLAADLRLFFCVHDDRRPFADSPHAYYRYRRRAAEGTPDRPREGAPGGADGSEEGGTEPTDDDDPSRAASREGEFDGKSSASSEDGRDRKASLEDGDMFDDSPVPRTSGPSDEGGCVQFDLEEDEPASKRRPSAKMSAFNMSMRMMLDDEDDLASSSDLGSVASDLNYSSVVDGLLFEDARCFDKYGFAVDREAEKEKPATESALHKKYAGCDLSDDEWGALLDQCDAAAGALPKSALTKIKLAMRLGLSDCHRQRAWTLITGVDILLPKEVGHYRSLVRQGFRSRSSSIGGGNNGQTLMGVIERDLHRTFPRHILFCGAEGTPNEEGGDSVIVADNGTHSTDTTADESGASHQSLQLDRSISTVSDVVNSYQEMSERSGPAALRRLLYAYSVYDPEVGYCQGMNFIAAMFLTFLPEEESFWMLVAVMNEEPYEMRSMFLENMAGTHKALYITDKLIKKYLPKLVRYFQRENIEVSMFATQWIMTVFASSFSFELVARVWDSFLVEGWKVVYRVVLALLDHASSDLMELTMEEIFDYFRNLSSKIDGQAIILASLNIPLKNRDLHKYGQEWERMQFSASVFHGRRASVESNVSGESGSKLSEVGPEKGTGTPTAQRNRMAKKIVSKLPFMS